MKGLYIEIFLILQYSLIVLHGINAYAENTIFEELLFYVKHKSTYANRNIKNYDKFLENFSSN